MKFKTTLCITAGVACFSAVAYAAAPIRSAAPASRALQLRSQYNPFSLQREPVKPQPVVAPVVVVQPTAQPVAIQSHRPGRPVRPPHRPKKRSPYQPPGRGPYFDPPGPPPNVPPGQNR